MRGRGGREEEEERKGGERRLEFTINLGPHIINTEGRETMSTSCQTWGHTGRSRG